MKTHKNLKAKKMSRARENLETTPMISIIEEEQRKSLKEESSNVTDATRLI